MQLPDLLRSIAAELSAVPDEALAVYHAGRGVGPLRSSPRFVPVGHAWRLGMFLLDADARLYLTGEVTRAVEPGIALLSRSPSAEQRRDYRAAAARGKFAPGRVINFNYRVLDGVEEPLFLDGDTVRVHLDTGGTAPLETYLRERVSLLLGES